MSEWNRGEDNLGLNCMCLAPGRFDGPKKLTVGCHPTVNDRSEYPCPTTWTIVLDLPIGWAPIVKRRGNVFLASYPSGLIPVYLLDGSV